MSEQSQRPTTEDRDAWRAYWQAQGMPWRTEPEIGEERRAYLAERRAVTPDIERGIYPFHDENGGIHLTRADVEWLLATHESGGLRGPVDWSDAKQRKRDGLDLRGADLRHAHLTALPLSRLRGGLTHPERRVTTHVQRHMAAVHLDGADLDHAHLEQACLGRVRMHEANLEFAHLEQADLGGARLEHASLRKAHLGGAYLRRAFFDAATNLDGIVITDSQHGAISLVDASWGGANLSTVHWADVSMPGDERKARMQRPGERKKNPATRLQEYEDAVRANRQLAIALRGQGLNEYADRFAYRAQVLQRIVLWRQHRWGRYLFAALLDALAGHGYRPGRSILTYLAVVLGFAAGYYLLGHNLPMGLTPQEALFTSIVSFHGRGFFPSSFNLANPIMPLVALEAILGLLIEITFIATFTQRFFAR
jgi:hypothetical protein